MSAGDRPAQADAEFDLAASFLPARSHEIPAIETRPAASASDSPPKGKRRNLVLDFFVVLGVAVVYLLSLFGYHWLATAPGQLAEPDLSTEDNSVVLVRIEQLHPVEHRLDVKVLVMPDSSVIDKRLGVLTSDALVRFDPDNDLGDLQYPKGKSPAQVVTTIQAHGNPGDWPFDTYQTDRIQADVLTGDNREYKPARVEVTGLVEGWDVSVTRVGRDGHDPNRPDNVIITLQRAKGPLVFDLGICLVLVALPTLALFVAIQMFTGRRKFLPPFSTWYAAMLFAVVPLRNILPGSPPAGSWIDQAVVIWVLIGLATALVLYVFAWHRQGD
jgi:hypothetical protein